MRMMQVRRVRKAIVKVMMPTTTKGSNSVIVHSHSVSSLSHISPFSAAGMQKVMGALCTGTFLAVVNGKLISLRLKQLLCIIYESSYEARTRPIKLHQNNVQHTLSLKYKTIELEIIFNHFHLSSVCLTSSNVYLRQLDIYFIF